MSKNIEQKVQLAKQLINDLVSSKERLLIFDEGCIATYQRIISPWFLMILAEFNSSNYITFAIASKYRPRRDLLRKNENIFAVEVPELDKKERGGLLSRYCDFEQVSLPIEEMYFFAELLNGFPEQVFFTVELIKENGLVIAKKRSHEIIEFNSERANRIISKYEVEERKIDFLAFLAHFDFISYEFIFDIVDDDNYYEQFLGELISLAVCELMGANREYVRINDALRDYIIRSRIRMPEYYKNKIEKHLSYFLKTYKNEDKDAFDYLFSLKEALLAGKKIDDIYLIPSHFLKTMKDLYDQYNRYDEVVTLADRVLQNHYYLDSSIKENIQYYLCLSLARKKSDRFLSEVQKINGPEHKFLLGFYYRLMGRYEDAITNLEIALGERENFSRARRELVQVYSA